MIHYFDKQITVYHGDSRVVLRDLPDASVDAVVTDPPYGLEFMGKEWDGADGFRRSLNPNDVGRDNVFGRSSRTSPEYRALHSFQEWCEAWARECLRVLKPGGHLLAFGGTRTFHRLGCAIEDAGFEIRDSILAWLYGSGFPKSLDVSKAIDKAAGVEREVVGMATGRAARPRNDMRGGQYGSTPEGSIDTSVITSPATPDAERWQGWGTALKPAFEPIVVGRKPLAGTVAANVLTHGTGALNIGGCRVATDEEPRKITRNTALGVLNDDGWQPKTQTYESPAAGRWPANVVLDEYSAAELDQQAPVAGGSGKASGPSLTGTSTSVARGTFNGVDDTPFYGDIGGASRFFYVAKADSSERVTVNGVAHPTVKPLDLMRWLVRLVTPPGGTVLEPFAGSGTTVEAALLEGFNCIAIERDADYLPLIEARIARRRDPVRALELTRTESDEPDLFGGVA